MQLASCLAPDQARSTPFSGFPQKQIPAEPKISILKPRRKYGWTKTKIQIKIHNQICQEWGKSLLAIFKKTTTTKTELTIKGYTFYYKKLKKLKNPTVNEIKNINNIHAGKTFTKYQDPQF